MRTISVLFVLLSLTSLSRAQELLIGEKDRMEDFVNRNTYAFSYNESYELSSWIAYTLTPAMAENAAEADIKFSEDPKIMTGTADKKDYKKSGYETGLLIPAEPFAGDNNTLEFLGYFTNAAPMKPGFYNMTWKNIEKLFRAWSISEQCTLHIIAGSVLSDAPFKTIGDNNVSVPERFYKAVYDVENNRAVAFVFKNTYQANVFEKYAMSIDALEEIIDKDLFENIEDNIENEAESVFEKSLWNWDAVNEVFPE